MKQKLKDKLMAASTQDSKLYTERGKEEETFGHNPEYLEDTFGITKVDLIRLERAGMALKARYVTRNPKNISYFKDDAGNPVAVDGPHRVRWIIFKPEAV